MGVEVDIEVDGIDETARALRDGLTEGLRDAGEWTLDEGEDEAKNIILSADREWRKTLKRGFFSKGFVNPSRFDGRIQNTANHAKIVEDGLNPGNSPPVQRILPWVDDKIQPNAEAQNAAASANPSNWDPELQAAAMQYGPAKIITAFAIKGKLEKEGYRGIQFMKTTEQYLQQTSPMVFRAKIRKHMKNELRKAKH